VALDAVDNDSGMRASVGSAEYRATGTRALAVTCLVFAMIATGCHATHETPLGGRSSPSPDPHAAALAVAREFYYAWVSGKLDTAGSLATPDAIPELAGAPGVHAPTSCQPWGDGGDLLCGSAEPGYSTEFVMTTSGDGRYLVSEVFSQTCDEPYLDGHKAYVFCEMHP
jgi:hypothetical protein